MLRKELKNNMPSHSHLLNNNLTPGSVYTHASAAGTRTTIQRTTSNGILSASILGTSPAAPAKTKRK
jgi:hypothetical protein